MHRFARFATIGAVSTLAHACLFLALRGPLHAGAANVVALALCAVANTHANRSLTFGVRGRRGLVGQHARAGLVFAFTVTLTSAALGALHVAAPQATTALELAVLVVAGVVATVVRYGALRWWVFPGSIPGTSQASPSLGADAG
jgi:putative flippase GtrA